MSRAAYRRLSLFLTRGTIALFVLLGLGLVSLSFVPIEFIQRKAHNFRLYGMLYVVAGLVTSVGKRYVESYIQQIAGTFGAFASDVIGRLKATVQEADTGHRLAFLLVLALGIALRIRFLFVPMRYDESFTFLEFVRQPIYLSISLYFFPNNHLFNTLLMKIAYLAFGNQPWALRLPAFLAGVLLIPAVYLFVRAYSNKTGALIATSFVAASSFLIEYATNARGYSTVCLIFLLILTLATYLKQHTSPTGWLTFAVLSVLGFYAIPIMLYPYGIVLIWLALSILLEIPPNSRKELWQNLVISICITGVLTFILYTPVFVISGMHTVIANDFVLPEPWPVFLRDLPLSLGKVWAMWHRDVPVPIIVLLPVGFAVSLLFRSKLTTARISLVLATLIWVFPVVLVQRVVPFARVWLFLLPVYMGLAAAGTAHLLTLLLSAFNQGIDSKPARILFPTLTLIGAIWLGANVLGSQSVYYSTEDGTLRAAEQITQYLRDRLQPGDAVVFTATSAPPLTYYFYSYGIPYQQYVNPYEPAQIEGSQNVYVIVNYATDSPGSPETVLQAHHLSTSGYSAPVLLQTYEDAELYLMAIVQ